MDVESYPISDVLALIHIADAKHPKEVPAASDDHRKVTEPLERDSNARGKRTRRKVHPMQRDCPLRWKHGRAHARNSEPKFIPGLHGPSVTRALRFVIDVLFLPSAC